MVKIDKEIYYASHRFEDTASGATENFFIDNPSDSGVTLLVERMKVSAQQRTFIDVYQDVTEDSQGTTLTVSHINPADSDTSSVTVTHGGTYSGRSSDPFIAMMAPAGLSSGSSGAAPVDESSTVSVTIVPPGHNLLFDLTNDSASAGDINIVVRMAE